MYIAMNRFQIVPGKEADFENVWKSRQTYLDSVPGFKEFHLLRGEGGVFISHSTWETQSAFLDWTKSEAFHKAHAQGGTRELLQGPPQFSGYEVVI